MLRVAKHLLYLIENRRKSRPLVPIYPETLSGRGSKVFRWRSAPRFALQ